MIIVILELPYLIYAPIAIFEYTYYEFNNSIQHSSNQNNNIINNYFYFVNPFFKEIN